jgi:hypothetical protein
MNSMPHLQKGPTVIRGWCSCLVGINMAFVTVFHGMDIVVKQSGPEIAHSNYFLGGGHPEEVTTTSVTMEIIQNSISFVDGQTSMEDGVDPSSIYDVTDKEIVRIIGGRRGYLCTKDHLRGSRGGVHLGSLY